MEDDDSATKNTFIKNVSDAISRAGFSATAAQTSELRISNEDGKKAFTKVVTSGGNAFTLVKPLVYRFVLIQIMHFINHHSYDIEIIYISNKTKSALS
jgi:mRNA-degrading endonuclease HigB of HigAB toxin-antitoxin module